MRSARPAGFAVAAVALSLSVVACGGSWLQRPSHAPVAPAQHSRRTTARESGGPAAHRVTATVRRYFAADANANYIRMARLSKGRLSALWSLFDAEFGSCTCPPETIDITRLRVVKIGRATASLDLSARSTQGTL